MFGRMPGMKMFYPASVVTGFIVATAELAMWRNSVADLPLKRRSRA
jgi:hypothetical protein